MHAQPTPLQIRQIWIDVFKIMFVRRLITSYKALSRLKLNSKKDGI